MKKFFYILIALIAIGVTAGNNGTIATGGPYKVGDYYNDGIKEGIVFEVYDGGLHGKIVSLYDFNHIAWVDESIKNSIINSTSNDGEGNTNKVMSRADCDKFYAFSVCRQLGSDWYLPAKFELAKLHARRLDLNSCLKYHGGEPLNGWYWSSTESTIYPDDYAYGYIIWVDTESEGGEFNDSKRPYEYPNQKVRAIAKF